jgi:hypothetical protein
MKAAHVVVRLRSGAGDRPWRQLSLHDAVFGGQIFIPRQQLLVHRPRHVGQDTRPIHHYTDPRRQLHGPSAKLY